MPDANAGESVETRQSWIIAVTAVTMLALAAGAPLTVVIGLVPIAETLGSGRSVPSLATSLAYLGSGVGGVVCGLLAARVGQRAVAMMGGVAIFAGLALASLGQGWSLLAGIGLGVGLFGNGALFAPIVAYVSLWFDRRRGTALALSPPANTSPASSGPSCSSARSPPTAGRRRCSPMAPSRRVRW